MAKYKDSDQTCTDAQASKSLCISLISIGTIISRIRPRGYTFFVLNSVEHEIFLVQKF